MKPQMQAWILERRQQILAAPGVSEADLEELVAAGHYGDVVIVADELVIVPADVTFEPANVIYSNGMKPSEVRRQVARTDHLDRMIEKVDMEVAQRSKRVVHRASQESQGTTKTTKTKSRRDTFACPECGQSLATPQALGAHRSKLHGVLGKQHQGLEQPREQPKSALVCPECGKSYSFRGFFENHMTKAHPKGDARERALREAGLA